MIDPKVHAVATKTRQASGVVPFGAAVVRSGANTALPVSLTGDNPIGIADMDNINHDRSGQQEGFWMSNDNMPIIVTGEVRLWVVPNGQAGGILDGDYLEVADLGSGSQSGDHGCFEEAGSTAGGTRTATTMAQALEDVAMSADTYKPVSVDVAVGDTVITLTAADITSLALSPGDYILMEDLSADIMVNRVVSTTATTITLQMASLIAMVATDSDLITKMFQCKAKLV